MMCKCFQYKIALFVCIFSLFAWGAYGQGACAESSRWFAVTENAQTGEVYEYYTADEFFSGTNFGASIPGYDGDPVIVPHFYFSDTSCSTDEFEIEYEVLSYYVGGEVTAIAGMKVDMEPANPFLRSGANVKRVEVESVVKAENNGLRANFGYGISTLGFKFKDGILSFMRNGRVYRRESYPICKIRDLEVYWENGGGGTLVSIRYNDITNGTEYYENFLDCRNEQSFPECEPEPVVELTAEVVLPDCKDSTLRFYANSNLLEDFHWIGPDGFSSDEQNPIIGGASHLKNGTYTVWGQLDRCTPPVSFDVVVDIPDILERDTSLSFEFCRVDSVVIGGKVYKESGSYVDTLVGANGCDSIIFFDIDKKYTEHIFSDTICYGDTYSFGGKVLSEAGFYVEAFSGANSCGCDSVVYLSLTVLPKPEYTEKNLEICQGDSVEVNGLFYKDKGVVYDTIKGRFGCDSLIVGFNIDVLSDGWEVKPEVHFCEGVPVVIEGGSYDMDTTLIDTTVGSNGCPLYLVTNVVKDEAHPLPDSFYFAGCRLSELTLNLPNIKGAKYKWTPRIYLSSDTVSNPTVRPYTDVEYKVVITQGNCIDEVPVAVRIFDLPKIVRVEQNEGEGAVVVRKGSKPYMYSFSEGVWSRDSTFSDMQTGMHQVLVEDALGCSDSANFYVFIPIEPEDHLSPNGDGIKDFWEIENIEQYDKYVIRIYDRFGKLLVEYKNQYPGWDGTYNGEMMPSTDYWYVINLEFLDYELSGHFTLVR